MSKKEIITVRVQQELKTSLEKVARALKINVSDIVREATELYLKGYNDSKHVRDFIARLYTYLKAFPNDSKVIKTLWLPEKDKILQRYEEAKRTKERLGVVTVGYKVIFYKSKYRDFPNEEVSLGVIVKEIEVWQYTNYDYALKDFLKFEIEIYEVDGELEKYNCSRCIGKEEIEIVEKAMKQ